MLNRQWQLLLLLRWCILLILAAVFLTVLVFATNSAKSEEIGNCYLKDKATELKTRLIDKLEQLPSVKWTVKVVGISFEHKRFIFIKKNKVDIVIYGNGDLSINRKKIVLSNKLHERTKKIFEVVVCGVEDAADLDIVSRTLGVLPI